MSQKAKNILKIIAFSIMVTLGVGGFVYGITAMAIKAAHGVDPNPTTLVIDSIE